MNSKKQITRLNDLLGAELGRTIDGRPLYKWLWSETPELMHPMRVQGKYDYVADPQSGLVEAKPVYTLRKMCLSAEQQWVLCHWIDSPSESEWRNIFGYQLEWPKGGQYYPTTVTLDPGFVPDESFTSMAIVAVRESRKKTGAEVEREATEAMEKAEAKKQADQYEDIRESCTTYDHVPGARDQVSYPAVAPKAQAEPLVRIA